ncbi:hypothetical protein RHMOL_Rhmol07G0251800 [Rhododendron molle]|uniref:Uncharacterized protein n=1 Tax=Rhododendron molle TaxID=49168 RepID=A0ACC0N4S5_RHOML|nr:hypothetical protein RHMOL_Rhmol07G0251800 [Rhododendron molle]
MPNFGDVFRLIWNMITGLEYKSNWFMHFMLGLCLVIAVVMFIIGYASEGSISPSDKSFLEMVLVS